MRRIIILCILLSSVFRGIFAQQIEIKGRVLDANDKEALEFVNVVLQNADSVFVTGVVTDPKGYFTIEKLVEGDYQLVISSLGYTTQYVLLSGLLKSIDLGNIILEDAPVSLDGVTVSASSMKSYSDKKIIFPTNRQLKASTNGMNLLQQLMLPKIQVNPMTNTISIPGGGEVQLRINGVKVEIQEIKALSPSDVIRVEFYDNPGLRYGNAEIVLNYIVRRPDTGGNIGVDMTQGVNALWGEHNFSAKINHKKSEFGASYRVGPRDFYGMKRNNEEIFHLSDENILHRLEEGEPDRGRMFMHNLNLNYSIQETDKYLFNATLRYWQNNNPRWDYHGILYNVTDPSDKVEMIDKTKQRTHRPALDLYYQMNLKNEQTLVFNLVGTYNKDESHRIYKESREDLQLIDNYVSGNKYSIIGEAIYEKKLKNSNRISTGIRHNQAFSDNVYRNGNTYTTNMTQAETYLYGEFKGQCRKFDYTLGAGLSRYWFHQDGTSEAYQYYTFRPKFTLQYNLPSQSYVRLNAYIGNSSPSLSNLSAVEQIIDSLQIQRGNPNLKPYMNYGVGLTYEIQKGIFYGNAWGSYEYSPKAIMDEKYIENGKIVQTWDNQKNWQRVAGRMMFRVGPIKDLLQFSFTGGVNHYLSKGNTYSHTYTNWFCEAQASLTYKKFSLMYQMNTNWNWFWGETMSGGENIQMIMLNYRHKNLSVGVGAFNPFTDNYKQLSENWNQYASYKKSNYIKESCRLFLVNISYNFSFGRTYKSGQKRVNNSDSDSGVMSTGK